MSFQELSTYFQIALQYIDNLHIRNQSIIDEITLTRSILQLGSVYTVAQQKITALSIDIANLEDKQTNLFYLKTEIESILALSDNNKAQLGYFHSVIKVDTPQFIIKLLFHIDNVLNNADINALMMDTITPRETKIAIAHLIYDTFTIDARVNILIPNCFT